MERVEEGSDTAFGDVGVDALPSAELVNAEVEGGHCGLCGGKEGRIISIPQAGYVVGWGDGISCFVMFNPSD